MKNQQISDHSFLPLRKIDAKLLLIIFCLILSSGAFGEPNSTPQASEENKNDATKKTEISIDVDFATMSIGSNGKRLNYKFIITLKNISDRDITLPTRSFDGEPCCWMTGGDTKGVTYSVGKWSVGDKVIIPSPARFFPMVLHPGEITQFAKYETSVDKGKEPLIKSFWVSIYIDKDYAEMQNWWYGELHCQADLTKKKPVDYF